MAIQCVAAVCCAILAAAAAAVDVEPRAPAPVPTPEAYTLNVAVVIYPGVELLDFAGPGEVFAVAGNYGRWQGQRAYNVYTVAADADPIESQGFVTVTPEYTIEDAPAPDVLVLPGGPARQLTNHEAFMDWAATAMESAVTLSVCTGAAVPAALGKLDGLTVTTWYGAVDAMDRNSPDANFVHGRRLVDNGSIITTAGVSAGIDGALHLVARTCGRVVADKSARYMEYRWTPEPYLARHYPLLNPRVDDLGRVRQRADLAYEAEDWPAAARLFASVVEESSAADPLALRRLGYALIKLERYRESIGVHERMASAAPVTRPTAYYNIACAHARLGAPDDAIAALERAVEAGFNQWDLMREDPDLASLRDLPAFQNLVGAMRGQSP